MKYLYWIYEIYEVFMLIKKTFIERKDQWYTHEHMLNAAFMQLAWKHFVGLWEKTANVWDWVSWVLNLFQGITKQ